MSLVSTGRRQGPFVLFSDDAGLRHAVRLGVILALSDADERQDATIVMMPGNRIVMIREPLEEVVGWFT